MQKETSIIKKEYSTAYIDAANIEKGLRDLGWDLDLSKFKIFLHHKFNCNRFIYFTGKINKDEYYQNLVTLGYEIIFKESIKIGNKIKANCDVDLSHNMTLNIERGLEENIILCSGDGDFSILHDFAKTKNVGFSVVSACIQTCSYLLRKRNMKIYFLDIKKETLQKRAISD